MLRPLREHGVENKMSPDCAPTQEPKGRENPSGRKPLDLFLGTQHPPFTRSFLRATRRPLPLRSHSFRESISPSSSSSLNSKLWARPSSASAAFTRCPLSLSLSLSLSRILSFFFSLSFSLCFYLTRTRKQSFRCSHEPPRLQNRAFLVVLLAVRHVGRSSL